MGGTWQTLKAIAGVETGAAERKLKRGAVYDGLRLHARARNWPRIIAVLENEVPMPNQTLRYLIVGEIKQLLKLGDSVNDRHNALPDVLRRQILNETNDALDALLHASHRLAAVTRLGADLDQLHEQLETEDRRLRLLSEATRMAKIELAKVTLAAGAVPVKQAAEQFKRLGWSARELRQIDLQIEPGD